MKRITNSMIIFLTLLLLVGCGGETTSSNAGSSSPLRGGTSNAPKNLQFDKPYYFGVDYGTSYVKFTVKRNQRLTFERFTNGSYGSWNAYGHYYRCKFFDIFDAQLQKNNGLFIAAGDNNSCNMLSNSVFDYIFLKGGTYIAKFHFFASTFSNATKGTITVRDHGISQLPKVKNKGGLSTYISISSDGETPNYHGYLGRKYYSLEMKKAGDVRFYTKDGVNKKCSAYVYDTNFNILDYFVDVADHLVTLAKGSYLVLPLVGCYAEFK